ncbi:hypothetical protein XELAEV_18016501mg [Xenopus laevis]|uniref:Uncharacterized protein n=1 Tax=Xenopus laevis TaxID=8355 RepID=A0A974DM05_XENLA|nr:hypothetical protein XELAEV_18016501mg [Xenopus laevis]
MGFLKLKYVARQPREPNGLAASSTDNCLLSKVTGETWRCQNEANDRGTDRRTAQNMEKSNYTQSTE